ncbi:MAG TPA: hypothetical protein ENN56_04045 [Firmicutes bacterium]|nr:hypothetical protein [Bacillota bacterium]
MGLLYEKQKRTASDKEMPDIKEIKRTTPPPRTIGTLDDAWDDELTDIDETEEVDAIDTELDTEEYDDALI